MRSWMNGGMMVIMAMAVRRIDRKLDDEQTSDRSAEWPCDWGRI